jgi:hypothetical protein
MKKEICNKLCNPPYKIFKKERACAYSCGIDKCCLECTLTGKSKHSGLGCSVKPDAQGILFKYIVLKTKYKKAGKKKVSPKENENE